MLGALLGTAAKAAVTGAAGLAVIGVLKESKVGDALREVVVTVTEAGVRGYKLVEAGVDKVADMATDVFNEAKNRADDVTPDTADTTTSVNDEKTDAEVLIDEAVGSTSDPRMS